MATQVVDDPGGLTAALATVDAPVVGLDVERDDGDRYFRRPALIQVGTARRCLLIDPLAIPDLDGLDTFLATRTTVLHSLENDLEALERVGVSPRLGSGRRRVEDTQVAAAMLGLPLGLADLLTDELGVVPSADKDRYQRAAWERRPLTPGMRTYAAEDVIHLPALWALLETRLAEAGRRAWYGQELLATAEQAREDGRHWTDPSGAGSLTGAQRAVLRALWTERERLARETDTAPALLLRDETLVDLATDPAGSAEELIARDGRRRGGLVEHAPALLEAQRRGRSAPPRPRPADAIPGRDQREAHDALRRVRSARARELDLDPGVLCPNRQLWAAVAAAPTSADGLAAAGGLRPWQVEVLGDELWTAYRTAIG